MASWRRLAGVAKLIDETGVTVFEGTVVGAGGSQDLGAVLLEGGDPDGHPVTGTLLVTPGNAAGIDVQATSGGATKLLNLVGADTVFWVNSDGTVHYESDDQALMLILGVDGTQGTLQVGDDSNRLSHRLDSVQGYDIFDGGSPVFGIHSGVNGVRVKTGTEAPANVALVSGAGHQVDLNADRETYTPVTTDGSNNLATCLVEVSADDLAYTALYTLSIDAAINVLGAVALPVAVKVPGGWFLRLTVAHAAIGQTVYY